MVARLIQLIRLRNEHPAFGGTFRVLEGDDQLLHLRWQRDQQWAELKADLKALAGELILSDGTGGHRNFALAV